MCGRYTSTSSAEQLAEVFRVDDVRSEPLPARWNVAPSLPVFAVADRVRDGESRRQLGAFRWGLVPSWAKDPAVGNRMINARADSITERPAYRSAFARRRCIIPADAFYEWQAPPDPAVPGAAGFSGRAGKRPKVPWAVRRTDGQPMAFAGLWEVWKDPAPSCAPAPAATPPAAAAPGPGPAPAPAPAPAPEGQLLRTCAIITTEANVLLSPIHSRMPVVLPASAWDQWLDPANEDVGALQALLVPAPAEWFEAFRVSFLVNSVLNDGPELVDPAPGPDDLPELGTEVGLGDQPTAVQTMLF